MVMAAHRVRLPLDVRPLPLGAALRFARGLGCRLELPI
jgi:hypothetical protein